MISLIHTMRKLELIHKRIVNARMQVSSTHHRSDDAVPHAMKSLQKLCRY